PIDPTNHQIWSPHPQTKNADFLMFFARQAADFDGEAKVDDLIVDITIPGQTKPVLQITHNPKKNQMAFWHSEYSDPIAQVTDKPINIDGQANIKRRFLYVRPMQGKTPLFNVGSNARSYIIPIKQLEQELAKHGVTNINQVSMRVRPTNGVEVTEMESMEDPAAQLTQWSLSEEEQKIYFPPPEPYHKIPSRPNRIDYDEKNELVVVHKNIGTSQQKSYVYDHGILVGIAYLFRDGKEYSLIRINMAPSVTPQLRIPQYVESGFAQWLARMITTKQIGGAGQIQINVANVDKAVSVTLIRNVMENFNVLPFTFVPFGLYDPNVNFPKWFSNFPNSLARYYKPEWEPQFYKFGDVTKLTPERLNPTDILDQRLENNINEPLFVLNRTMPEPADAPGTPLVQIHLDPAIQALEQSMDANRATRLPVLHPNTEKEKFVETTDLAKTMAMFMEAGRFDLAEDIAEFISDVSRYGKHRLRFGYRNDIGANQQWSDEWDKPG
ncbi:hypothetical protein BVX98_02000, partial [bacterium F11]